MTATSHAPTVRAPESTNLAILGETLKISCVELMADYGLHAELSPAPAPQTSEPPQSVLVAGVDFMGNELRGTVTLWATQTVIAETTRAAPGMSPTDDLPEWTCELANQLIGRMKNKLRVYDVALTLNVPRLIPNAPESNLGVRYRFSCDYGAIAACLDVLLAPGFVLKAREIEEALIQEGEFTLF